MVAKSRSISMKFERLLHQILLSKVPNQFSSSLQTLFVRQGVIVLHVKVGTFNNIQVCSVFYVSGPAREKPAQSRQSTALQVRDMGNYSCQAESDKHSDKAIAQTRLLINCMFLLSITSLSCSFLYDCLCRVDSR